MRGFPAAQDDAVHAALVMNRQQHERLWGGCVAQPDRQVRLQLGIGRVAHDHVLQPGVAQQKHVSLVAAEENLTAQCGGELAVPVIEHELSADGVEHAVEALVECEGGVHRIDRQRNCIGAVGVALKEIARLLHRADFRCCRGRLDPVRRNGEGRRRTRGQVVSFDAAAEAFESVTVERVAAGALSDFPELRLGLAQQLRKQLGQRRDLRAVAVHQLRAGDAEGARVVFRIENEFTQPQRETGEVRETAFGPGSLFQLLGRQVADGVQDRLRQRGRFEQFVSELQRGEAKNFAVRFVVVAVALGELARGDELRRHERTEHQPAKIPQRRADKRLFRVHERHVFGRHLRDEPAAQRDGSHLALLRRCGGAAGVLHQEQ